MTNNKHESELLNSCIGKWVKVTFKDDTKCNGVLKRADFGFGYVIKRPDGNTVKFAKSLVRKIEKI